MVRFSSGGVMISRHEPLPGMPVFILFSNPAFLPLIEGISGSLQSTCTRYNQQDDADTQRGVIPRILFPCRIRQQDRLFKIVREPKKREQKTGLLLFGSEVNR